MKKILLVIIIFFPVFCFGQVKNDTANNELDSLFSKSNKSLVVIDGVIFEGLHISEVDVSNVSDMTILKGERATYIYGDKGKNGAIIITTKETEQQVGDSQNSEDNGSAIKKKKIGKSKYDIGQPISLNIDSVGDVILKRMTTPIRGRANYLDVVLADDFSSAPMFKEQYEATVLDAGFDSFLATQKSKDFYSIASLKAKNEYLVSEWNYRCGLPSVYNPNVYEQKIDYESRLDYELDVEYTVYMFFKFMAQQNDILFNTIFI